MSNWIQFIAALDLTPLVTSLEDREALKKQTYRDFVV